MVQSVLTSCLFIRFKISEVRQTAAMVIAKVGAIELPLKGWPQLLESLVRASETTSHPLLVQAALFALGYVCEELADHELEVLQKEDIDRILTAVAQGIKSGNMDIKLAGTEALYNALEFAQSNFEREGERDYLMQIICEAAECNDERVQVAAFSCLVSIAGAYYEILPAYIGHIFEISTRAIRASDENVALQAIEFWSTICEEEIERKDLVEEGRASVLHHRFVSQALPHLTPILLETLLKQEEDQDLDECAWNLSMAGGTCLGYAAVAVGDEIVPLVMPFIQENISQTDWHNREAATFAFGSILEGPNPQNLAPMCDQALQFLLQAMKDPSNQVKDTTAWTIGRICEFCHGEKGGHQVIRADNIQTILAVLLEGLKGEPHVAEKICGAIHYLAAGFEDMAEQSPLTPYFQSLLQGLLEAADRADNAQYTSLRSSAYEALNEVVRCSSAETSETVNQMIPLVMQKLAETFSMPAVTAFDREKQGELQGLLCGVLQVIIQKLSLKDETKHSLQSFADQMMELFLHVFACRSATVHEEAMLAIGALAYAVGESFEKYMAGFLPYLLTGLKNFSEYQVCTVTVGVVGDLSRALESKLAPHCDSIMVQLFQDLQSDDMHRSVKPAILSCFGDIALAIGADFANYLPYAMQMLQSASQLSIETSNWADDEELVDYNNSLRTGICEAYSGILVGLRDVPGRSEGFRPYADNILSFIDSINNHREQVNEEVTRATIALLGDLADALDGMGALFRSKPSLQDFVVYCMSLEDLQIRQTAGWATEVLQRRLQEAGAS